jgi:hypothetical protein
MTNSMHRYRQPPLLMQVAAVVVEWHHCPPQLVVPLLDRHQSKAQYRQEQQQLQVPIIQ